MKILITGGSGFIGTNLVSHFVSRGKEILNFDISPPRNSQHVDFWQQGDITNLSDLAKCIKDYEPSVILHMAARTDLDGSSISDYKANTIGVENLISAARTCKSVECVLFASSRLVCKIGYQPSNYHDYCPSTAYGESKVAGEEIVRHLASDCHFSSILVRPTSIWGPWFDIPYKSFFLAISKNRYMHPGTQSISKSFGFVLNTVHQIESLINVPAQKVNGRTFFLSDYPPLVLSEFANCIQSNVGSKDIRTVNLGLLRVLANAGDLLKLLGYKHPPLTTFRLNNLITPMIYDLSDLEEIVGTLPYSMEEGVEITTSWMRSIGEIG